MKQQLVLMGDSILDNAPYTRPDPDTAHHLQQLVADWEVKLLAVDGATMSDMPAQIRRLDGKPHVAILSIGGNDVTRHIGVLDKRVSSSSQTIDELFSIVEQFGERYEKVARAVAEKAHRTVLCTIYEVQLEPREYARLVTVPLAMLNDRIIRTASTLGLDVLELRTVCTSPSDFVMQIEPSGAGARKIAQAIARLVSGESGLSSARVFSAK